MVDLAPMEYLLSLNLSHVTRVLKDLQALSQEHDDAIATLESTKSIFLLHSNEVAWLLKQHCDDEYTKTTSCLLEGRLPDHLFPDDECHGDHIEDDDRGYDDQEHKGLDEEESEEEVEEEEEEEEEEREKKRQRQ
jgi:hypothetical protein